MQRFAPDNISIKSAPTLTRSTSGSHVCASPPTARPRAKKWPRGHAHYRLSSSASTSSLSSTTSTISRPKSYVPFEESFDTHIASVHGWAGMAGGRGRQAPPTGSHPPPSGSHGVRWLPPFGIFEIPLLVTELQRWAGPRGWGGAHGWGTRPRGQGWWAGHPCFGILLISGLELILCNFKDFPLVTSSSLCSSSSCSWRQYKDDDEKLKYLMKMKLLGWPFKEGV